MALRLRLRGTDGTRDAQTDGTSSMHHLPQHTPITSLTSRRPGVVCVCPSLATLRHATIPSRHSKIRGRRQRHGCMTWHALIPMFYPGEGRAPSGAGAVAKVMVEWTDG